MDLRRACIAFTRAQQIFRMITGMMDGPMNSPFAKKKQLGNQERLVRKPKNTLPVLLAYIQYLDNSGRTFQKDIPVVANVPADLTELVNETASDAQEASNKGTPGSVERAGGCTFFLYTLP